MSLTYGFYNSMNNDRKYDATQMSSIFDGIIRDGVFATIGTAMVVTADAGSTVKVGIGRAWFNHTWTLNDAILPITGEKAELLLDRIDAVVLEINASDDVRANTVKFVTGTPAQSPERPTMINTDLVHQYPLCYIYRTANSTDITQADITNMVGTSECPFVTGILDVINTDELIQQWKARFDEWMNIEQEDYTEWYTTMQAALEANAAALDEWIAAEQNEFTAWYEKIKGILTEDVVTNLQVEIEAVDNKADVATAIAKGKNQARVFATTKKMNEWLSDASNKGVAQKGDNLYIVELNVPDWWISEVLEEPNADGKYYEIAQLETQKVDLTTIENDITTIFSRLGGLTFAKMTSSAYEALATKDSNTIYFTT